MYIDDKNQSVLNFLLVEQKKIQKSESNILNVLEQGIITSTIKERFEELEVKQNEIAEKILIAKPIVESEVLDLIEETEKLQDTDDIHINNKPIKTKDNEDDMNY